jgi:hypothetical protein
MILPFSKFHLCSGRAKGRLGGACWWSLNTYFNHQLATNLRYNQHKNEEFGFKLMEFHLYMIFIWWRRNVAKHEKVKHQKLTKTGRSTRGWLVGSANPTTSPDAPATATSSILVLNQETQKRTHPKQVSHRFDPRATVELYMDPWAHYHTLVSSTDSLAALDTCNRHQGSIHG